MNRLVTLAVLCCLGILAVVVNATTSLATAPSGFGAPFTYRATIAPYHFHGEGFKIQQEDPKDVVMRQLTIAPGGSSGWHAHPGPVFVLVTQGTVTNYEAKDSSCTGRRISAGEGFVEPPRDVHMVRNEGSTTAVMVVTFLDVPVGGAFRIDMPRPGNCPF